MMLGVTAQLASASSDYKKDIPCLIWIEVLDESIG